jgi:predicted Co/Zn/Cd cation transporter (cation efflux family)
VGLLSLPVPLGAIRQGLSELLLFGPVEEVYQKVEELVRPQLDTHEFRRWKSFVLKTGRKHWITVLIDPQKTTVSAAFPDQVRKKIRDKLQMAFPVLHVDVILTQEDHEYKDPVNKQS